MEFAALKLHPTLLRGVEDLKFERPTPIQSQAIPRALEGRDLLACAATGSGKTAAFLLPILHKLMDKPRGTTRALVIAPTRELALQIVDDLNALARHTGIKGAPVYGGVKMGAQEKAFRQGVDIIVATPGRLLDHFQYGYAKLSGLECLVLDEADRMLDMGFLPDIRRVLKHIPKPEQTFFFSATMPPPIETLTRDMLRNPAKIALQRRAAPAEGVVQAVYPVPASLKKQLLVELFTRGHMEDALVFTRTKHRANQLTKVLNRNGISAERIHGNRSQAQRTKALAGFKAGKFRVLVATDIAARGIDVEALGHVVNFDIPGLPEDYIHRVGRTARAELTGEAFTLVAPEDEATLGRIERTVGSKINRVVLEDFSYQAARETAASSTSGRRNGNGKVDRAGSDNRQSQKRGNWSRRAGGNREATPGAGRSRNQRRRRVRR